MEPGHDSEFRSPGSRAEARWRGIASARASAAVSARTLHVPLIAIVTLFLSAARVAAQDFAAAAPALAEDDPLSFLDRGLPPGAQGIAAIAASTRWWGLRDLETHAVAANAAWRSLRTAAGVSQTGTPDLGWTALALAVGGATEDAGSALRACVRADRDAAWSPARVVSTTAGLELGGGAWLTAAPGVRLWASAPQLYTRGSAPPLSRALELGVRAGGDTGAWLTLRAPGADNEGERSLGVAVAVASFVAWAEARDGPLRGTAGVRAAVGRLHVDARVDSHPALGETMRMSVAWSRARQGPP